MTKEREPIESLKMGMSAPYSKDRPLPESLTVHKSEYLSLPDGNAQAKHVYAMVGLALYAAQCFETELQIAIQIAKTALGHMRSVEEIEELIATLNRKTLGQLLKEIDKVVSIDENGTELLGLALSSRNSLSHGYFYEHGLDFPTKAGRLKMVDDLLERIRLFNEAEAFISVAGKSLGPEIGLTPERLQGAFDELHEELQKQDAEFDVRTDSEGRPGDGPKAKDGGAQ